jgi:cell division protein FtsQ
VGSHASTAAGRRRASTRAAPRTKAKSAGRAGARGPAKGSARTGHRKPSPSTRATRRRRPAGRKARSGPATIARHLPRSLRSWFTAGRAWGRRLLVAAALVGALAVGYFGWFRDSSLVAVDEVTVQGVTGGDRQQIIAALTESAERMTTLHLREDQLETAVASFPTVAALSADAHFPHGVTIEVVERPPAMVARAGDQEIPVAADGTVLPGVSVPEGEELPWLELGEAPASGKLQGEALEQALILGAAPKPLAPLIEDVAYEDEHGVVVEMQGAIPIRFGSGDAAKAKWAATAAMLADPELTSVTYVDVRVPHRPAAGGAGL